MVEFLPGIHFSHFYVQEAADTGVMMETIVPTKDIKDGVNEFLEAGGLRVRILWGINLQLFQSTYGHYDEIYRLQREQMLVEVLGGQGQGGQCGQGGQGGQGQGEDGVFCNGEDEDLAGSPLPRSV